MTGELLQDSSVLACEGRPGVYAGAIGEKWKMFVAFGGMAFSIALRAARERAGAGDLEPVYASAAFSRTLACGPVEIETELLSSSLSTSQVLARLQPPGDARPHLTVLASFGRPAAFPTQLQELSFPDGVLPWQDAIPIAPGALPGFPLFELSTTRFGHDFWNRPGRQPSATGVEPAEVDSWIRYHVPPFREDGTWDPITFAAPADSMSPALFRGLGPDTPVFFPITVAMDLHVFATTRREWLLQRSRVARFVDGYACGIVELWDEDRTLLAVSTQRRFCKPLPPQGLPPSP